MLFEPFRPDLLDQSLEIVGAILGADQRGIGGMYDNEAVESQDADQVAGVGGQDQRILRLDREDLALDRVARRVLGPAVGGGAPGAYVVPLELGLEHEDALG